MLVSGGNSVCFSLMLGDADFVHRDFYHSRRFPVFFECPKLRNMFLINSGQAWDLWLQLMPAMLWHCFGRLEHVSEWIGLRTQRENMCLGP